MVCSMLCNQLLEQCLGCVIHIRGTIKWGGKANTIFFLLQSSWLQSFKLVAHWKTPLALGIDCFTDPVKRKREA